MTSDELQGAMERLCRRYQAMRDKQKEYFRTRSQFQLREAKSLEAALDRDVAAYLGRLPEHREPKQRFVYEPLRLKWVKF